MSVPPEIIEPDRRGDAPHPRETSQLFGQEQAEAQFLAALGAGRLHHAWLITGPPGIGKATLAWRIARVLAVGGPHTNLEMDPSEPMFREAAALAAPAIRLCRRAWDSERNRLRAAIGVEEIRALKGFHELSLPDGGWRVTIVDSADEMTPQAANALLKLLEEPPPQTVLILISHQPARLLPTIRSRCRVLRCARLSPADFAKALRAMGDDNPDMDVPVLAALADGAPGVAWDLLAGGGAALYRELVADLANAPGMSRVRAHAIAASCTGRDGAARFALTLDLMRIALARLARHASGAEVAPVSEDEARLQLRLGSTRASALIWADAASEIIARAAQGMRANLDPAQVILDTLFRIDAAAASAQSRAA